MSVLNGDDQDRYRLSSLFCRAAASVRQSGERGVDGARGVPGRDGVQGPRGERGEKGESGARAASFLVNPADYSAALILSDGSSGARLAMRPLFEAFAQELADADEE